VSPSSGAGPAVTIAESANIVEFLLRHYGKQFEPAQYVVGKESEGPLGESDMFQRYRYLMHFAEGSMMPYLVFSIVLNELKGPAVPFLVRPLTRVIAGQVEGMFTRPNVKKNYDLLEGFLAESSSLYFCGSELSGADFMLEYPVDASKDTELFKHEKYPHLYAWIERVHERPAYKAAVKKAEESMGKPFTLKL